MTCTAMEIPTKSEVLRCTSEAGTFESLAGTEAADAAADSVAETAVGPVDFATNAEVMDAGGNATANFLSITVAMEVQPEGVMVVSSARTAATPVADGTE